MDLQGELFDFQEAKEGKFKGARQIVKDNGCTLVEERFLDGFDGLAQGRLDYCKKFGTLGTEVMKAMLNLSARYKTRHLILSENTILWESTKLLADFIQGTDSLEELQLDNTKIGDDVKLLFEALCHNYTIEKLGLASCGITKAGTLKLAEILKINKSLLEINFSDNKIGNSGAKALGEALSKNKKLQSLTLQDCNLNNQQAVTLTSYLKENSTLTKLDLTYNHEVSHLGRI